MNGESIRSPAVVVVVGFALLSGVLALPRISHIVRGLHMYASMSQHDRERVAGASAGFPPDAWDWVRAQVPSGDRYAIETPVQRGAGFGRLIRTYASYWLLPAVAVTDARHADVVVYVGERPVGRAECFRGAYAVCVERR
jgi:hypothetical protein